MEKKKLEILAPAGSFESLKAAVQAGADAVYMGGSRFGARAYAQNPEGDRLLEAIDYAHLYGVKLYLTVNTLLKDKELEGELYDYLKPCVEHGLDAVIVQDTGVMKCIQRWFPELDIHASTQMTVTGPEGMKFLEEQGASRVVTARELSLDEIRRMHETSPIEIESFVHGALCYSYSGQCLMSSILGGRSGNRGRCAQPCRLPYQTGLCGEYREKTENQRSKNCTNKSHINKNRTNRNFENKNQSSRNRQDKFQEEVCPLSLKDISTIEILPQIIEAGVTSLKIEE